MKSASDDMARHTGLLAPRLLATSAAAVGLVAAATARGLPHLGAPDEVVTSGGVAGRITKVTDDFIVLEVADNVEMKIQKVAVAAAPPKGTLKDI